MTPVWLEGHSPYGYRAASAPGSAPWHARERDIRANGVGAPVGASAEKQPGRDHQSLRRRLPVIVVGPGGVAVTDSRTRRPKRWDGVDHPYIVVIIITTALSLCMALLSCDSEVAMSDIRQDWVDAMYCAN